MSGEEGVVTRMSVEEVRKGIFLLEVNEEGDPWGWMHLGLVDPPVFLAAAELEAVEMYGPQWKEDYEVTESVWSAEQVRCGTRRIEVDAEGEEYYVEDPEGQLYTWIRLEL